LATAVTTFDPPDLRRQVVCHHVDIIGEVLPDAGHPPDLGLSAELALGADLARYAGDLCGERAELVDHGVDGVLQLEDLALDVDRDLLRQVAVGHRGGHLGDVADLRREVAGHRVDAVRQILPRPGDAFDVGLAAELALGAHLARHPRDLRGERLELVHHRVDSPADPLERPARSPAIDRRGHPLREIPLGNGADHARHLERRLDQVAEQRIDRMDTDGPPAGGASQ
jgi:hypothetical protein